MSDTQSPRDVRSLSAATAQSGGSIGAVGVIGVGAMGGPMARRLLTQGYRVVVRDIVSERVDALVAIGATAATSAADVARQADVVFTVVVDAAQTDDVLFGADGVMNGVASSAHAGRVVVMCSTVAPRYAATLPGRVDAPGVEVIDAPISGGPRRALAGTLSMMLGAPSATLARVERVLADVATHRFHVGQAAGQGSAMKIVNNMLAGINLVAAAEALALAERLGMDLQMVHDVVNVSSGGSWMFADRVPRMLSGDFEPKAASKILTKDVGLALDEAEAANVPVSLARAAHRIFAGTVAHGLGDADDAAVIEYCRAQIDFAMKVD